MSLLRALRTSTREAHDRLEAGLDVPHRCRDEASYAAVLLGFRSVYGPLERALDRAPATPVAVPDWVRRRKTGWLDEDLAALGRRPDPDAAVPHLTTVEDVLGAAYVMEGATLGGAVLLAELRRSWPVLPPHRFFRSYGDARGAMWHGFRRQVEALPGLDAGAVTASARRTFAAFEASCLVGPA